MSKKLLPIIITVLLLALVLKACIRADIPTKESSQTVQKEVVTELKPSKPAYTANIEGREYLIKPDVSGKYGGTMYSSTIGEGPKTFNPINAKDATSAEFSELMFDGLTTTDPYTGMVIPKLAKKIDVSKDAKIYTVTLRKGLKWSDGKSITADDVTYTWNNIIFAGYGNTSIRDIIMINGKLPEVKKVDNLTVKFVLPEPFTPFERQLATSILPKHIFEPVVKKGKKEFDSFWGVSTPANKFVTSGAFKLSEYVPAQRVVFKRNPDYYMMDKEYKKLPYLDKYVVYIVGDTNNEILKFEAKELDILNIGGNNAARYKEFEKKSDYTVYNLGPNTGTMFLIFNMNTRKNSEGKYYVKPKKQRWFNDKNFRYAIDYAIDRESLVANILRGVGAPLFTAESLPSIFLNQKLKNGHPRDIKEAEKYLTVSGFKRDKKGILRDKQGNIVEFNMFTNAGNLERESAGVMIKQDCEELGMKVNFKPIEFNSLVNKLVNTYDWDVAIMGLTGSSLEPHGGKNVWASDGAMHIFNMRKENEIKTSKYFDWELQLDKIFEEGAKEKDFKKRKALYDKYQEIVYNEKPVIYLYSPLRITAVRNRLGNIKPTPIGGVVYNIEEIYIK